MKKKEVDSKYYDYFEGRPNIFILFIIKSLELLNKDGIMSFVLPKNFLLILARKYIVENYKILNIFEYYDDKYIDTEQDTIILIVKNEKPNDSNKCYKLNISEFVILGIENNIKTLKKLYSKFKTLDNLNFNINVGNVV